VIITLAQILMKRKRTVLLATDRLDVIDKADNVVFLRDGKIEAQVRVSEASTYCLTYYS
jgi:ABC-type bacteriocin/lantibiotic exporter with double-glycine peptidase domain